MNNVVVGDLQIGPDSPLTIIAGPCVAESLDLCLEIGTYLRDTCQALGLQYIFKASFDKANRSSIHSYRGPGIEQGLNWIQQVKQKLNVPVTTDIHEANQASQVGQVVDILQIPAFLCRQTDLLIAAAQTGLPVNVKKGQFLSTAEMANVVEKLKQAKAQGIVLTERGTFMGYQRLVNDFIGVADLMKLGCPVCFDVTHSTQLPGASSKGSAKTTGGRPDCAPMLARCAVVAGVNVLFIETHPDPENALSDAATMLPLAMMSKLLEQLKNLHQVARTIPD